MELRSLFGGCHVYGGDVRSKIWGRPETGRAGNGCIVCFAVI